MKTVNPLRPFAHLSDAEFDALRHDGHDHHTRVGICLEVLARKGKIYDSGERRNGQIVWKTVDPPQRFS
jgi:hypothetical protein